MADVSREAWEKSIATGVWQSVRPHPYILCPYDETHGKVGVKGVDGDVLLFCYECQVCVGEVPDYVVEYYRGLVKLGWIKPVDIYGPGNET